VLAKIEGKILKEYKRSSLRFQKGGMQENALNFGLCFQDENT